MCKLLSKLYKLDFPISAFIRMVEITPLVYWKCERIVETIITNQTVIKIGREFLDLRL